MRKKEMIAMLLAGGQAADLESSQQKLQNLPLHLEVNIALLTFHSATALIQELIRWVY